MDQALEQAERQQDQLGTEDSTVVQDTAAAAAAAEDVVEDIVLRDTVPASMAVDALAFLVPCPSHRPCCNDSKYRMQIYRAVLYSNAEYIHVPKLQRTTQSCIGKQGYSPR